METRTGTGSELRKQKWLPKLGRKGEMGKGREKELIYFNKLESFVFFVFSERTER